MAQYKSNYTGAQIDAGIAKANTAVQPADLNGYQSKIDSSHKLSADLIADGETNKTVTETEKTTWNNKGTYSKPSGGIPENDLSDAVKAKLNSGGESGSNNDVTITSVTYSDYVRTAHFDSASVSVLQNQPSYINVSFPNESQAFGLTGFPLLFYKQEIDATSSEGTTQKLN